MSGERRSVIDQLLLITRRPLKASESSENEMKTGLCLKKGEKRALFSYMPAMFPACRQSRLHTQKILFLIPRVHKVSQISRRSLFHVCVTVFSFCCSFRFILIIMPGLYFTKRSNLKGCFVLIDQMSPKTFFLLGGFAAVGLSSLQRFS